MTQEKKLYRSSTDVTLGGVCAGLADFFNMDPTIMRLIFVVLFLSGTLGFWVYIILWIVIPTEPAGYAKPSRPAGETVLKAESVEPVQAEVVDAAGDEIPEPIDLDDAE